MTQHDTATKLTDAILADTSYDNVFNVLKLCYGVGFDTGRLLGRGSRSIMQSSLFGKELAIYDSATIAARKTGLTQSRICKAAKNPRHSAGGYKWRFLDG